MQKLTLVLLSLLVLSAYSTSVSAQQKTQTFQQKLATHCGKSYAGKITYPVDDNYPFGNNALVIVFKICSADATTIDFKIGDNQTVTWLLTNTSDGLQLKHEQRQSDGTSDYFTMYGGISEELITSLEHRFPADEHTASLQPGSAPNEWAMALSPDGKTFSYILRWDGELRYHLDFDLTKQLN